MLTFLKVNTFLVYMKRKMKKIGIESMMKLVSIVTTLPADSSTV